LRDQTSPFSPANLASKAELVNTTKLASSNKPTGWFNVQFHPLATDGAVTKKILQKDERFGCLTYRFAHKC
jgi:hypothetical protein